MPNTPLQTDGCFAAAAERHAVRGAANKAANLIG